MTYCTDNLDVPNEAAVVIVLGNRLSCVNRLPPKPQPFAAVELLAGLMNNLSRMCFEQDKSAEYELSDLSQIETTKGVFQSHVNYINLCNLDNLIYADIIEKQQYKCL